MTNEEWYDAEIGPKLRELSTACADRGMSFQACVEYAPDQLAQTYQMMHPGLKMQMVQYCARTAPNIDSYVIGLAKHCREKGIDTSASIIMQKLTG